MTWNFEKIFAATPATAPKNMAFDGKYVWVTGTNAVYVYEYWGESSFDETPFENVDTLILNKYDSKLTLVATISVPNGSYWIVRSYNKMWVTSAASFDKITGISIEGRTVTDNLVCPKMMVSNLCHENGKLWMVNQLEEAVDRQSLHFYDLTTQVWSSSEIPTRKTLARTIVTAPYNGFVYVTNFNNVSIAKFSSIDGVYERLIRVNAFPTGLIGTSQRDLYVSSYAGMLSKVDTTLNTVTHPHSTLEGIKTIASDQAGSYLWFVNTNNRMVRMKKADNKMFFSDPAGPVDLPDDWIFNLDVSKFPETSFDQMLITPEFTYKKFNGSTWDTISVKPYMFLTTATKILAFRMDRPIYRSGFISLHGQAMISTGTEDYMGEVG